MFSKKWRWKSSLNCRNIRILHLTQSSQQQRHCWPIGVLKGVFNNEVWSDLPPPPESTWCRLHTSFSFVRSPRPPPTSASPSASELWLIPAALVGSLLTRLHSGHTAEQFASQTCEVQAHLAFKWLLEIALVWCNSRVIIWVIHRLHTTSLHLAPFSRPDLCTI